MTSNQVVIIWKSLNGLQHTVNFAKNYRPDAGGAGQEIKPHLVDCSHSSETRNDGDAKLHLPSHAWEGVCMKNVGSIGIQLRSR